MKMMFVNKGGKGGFGGDGGRGGSYGGGGRGGGRGFGGDARFRGRGNRSWDGNRPGNGNRGGGKGYSGGKGGPRGGGTHDDGKCWTPLLPLKERNAEVDRIDTVFGYERINQGRFERVGWLTNFRQLAVEDEETGVQLAAVEYYFIGPEGDGFKTMVHADPYFYISTQAGCAHEVEMAIRRQFPEQLKDMRPEAKEDLALPNHLSGLKKTYMRMLFRNTRDLMDVRKALLPTVQKNMGKRHANAAYNGMETDEVGRVSDNWLDKIDDIREYDVRRRPPTHHTLPHAPHHTTLPPPLPLRAPPH